MTRPMTATLLIAVCLTTLPGLDARADDKPDTSPSRPGDDVKRLMAEGRYEECLGRIRQWHESLPGDRRLCAWQIDFMNSEVDHAVVGSRHLYFTYHRPNSNKAAPGMKPTLPLVEPSRQSDWRHVVVCVDVRTGAICWSRPYGGLSRLVVDPSTDTLYLLGNDAIVALTPDGADPMMRPLTKGQRVVGLLTSQGLKVSAPWGLRSEWNHDAVQVYCPSTRSIVEVNLKQYLTLSPDESMRLVLSANNHHGFANNIICQTCKGDPLWAYQTAGLRSPCMPRFYEGDVIWLSGSRVQKGEAVRLEGRSGKVLWRTVLPNGAYKPSDFQLKGGGYAWDDWDPLMTMKDTSRLLAVDGTGRLFVLNGQTGAIERTARPAATHLIAPTWMDGLVVVCSYDKAMAIPEPMLFGPREPGTDERDVLVVKARCLTAMGRLQEALAVTGDLLARDEDCAEGWRARAEVCAATKDALEQSYSLCRYADLSGRATMPELRDGWGLLRLIPLGSRPAWQMIDIGAGPLYVGTQRGDLWAIQPDSLEARVVDTRDKEISGLAAEVRLRLSARTGRTTTDADAPADPAQPAEAPASWFRVTGRDGPAVVYRGKHYRPLGGGKVRIWDGRCVTERTSPLEGIAEWQLHFTPSGPLGYGTGGVFALDDDLCPTKRLIEFRIAGKKTDHVHVARMASVGDSLGLVVLARNGGAYLQVYGRSDGTLRSDEFLGRFLAGRIGAGLLTVLGNGYLVSNRQLVWAAGTGGRVWRFGPALGRTESHGGRRRRQHFGDPVVRDGKLLVTAADGCVYAFDTGRILTASPGP